jgi:hypothetical protein
MSRCYGESMTRLTLSLEEILRLYGTNRQEVEHLVPEARQRSGLSAEEAMDLAVRETAAARRQQRTARGEP